MDNTQYSRYPTSGPLRKIGKKWIDYAQEDCDPNDIAHAVWSAIAEVAALAQPAQPVMSELQDLLETEENHVTKRDDKQSDDFASGYRSGLRKAIALLSAAPAQPVISDRQELIALAKGRIKKVGDRLILDMICMLEHDEKLLSAAPAAQPVMTDEQIIDAAYSHLESARGDMYQSSQDFHWYGSKSEIIEFARALLSAH